MSESLRNTCEGTVYILASGPSADFVPLHKIKDRPVIAVNYELFNLDKGEITSLRHWVDFLHFRDPKFYKDHKIWVDCFDGQVIYGLRKGREKVEGRNISYVSMKKGRGLSPGKRIYGNSYTGASAINLAYWLGFREAILIGYDEDGHMGKWHRKDHPSLHDCSVKSLRSRQRLRYQKMAADARALGFKILNCSPKTRINSFQKIKQEMLWQRKK